MSCDQGGDGHFSNKRGFSVDSSLQRLFIEFGIVETKRFFDSNPNVILTRQTCGQRSSMAEAEHQQLVFHTNLPYDSNIKMHRQIKSRSVYIFGTCKYNAAAGGRLPIENVFRRKIRLNSPMCSGILFASTEGVHRYRTQSALHFDIGNIWQIRTEK